MFAKPLLSLVLLRRVESSRRIITNGEINVRATNVKLFLVIKVHRERERGNGREGGREGGIEGRGETRHFQFVIGKQTRLLLSASVSRFDVN